MRAHKRILAIIATVLPLAGFAQTPTSLAPESLSADVVITDTVIAEPVIPHYESLVDSLLQTVTDVEELMSKRPLPKYLFLPPVYTHYEFPKAESEKEDVFTPDFKGNPAMKWVEEAQATERSVTRILQNLYFSNPQLVKYNLVNLPEAPKEYVAVFSPDHLSLKVVEKNVESDKVVLTEYKDEKINWLKTFNGSLQFSQAYISPNWYQGGNNNLNSLLNLNYNIKLNQKLHPDYLFETNFQYKLGLYSTPDDSLRNYNISEDLLQINSTFGVKAVKKWYYTINVQFKTQLLNSYKTNTNTLRSSFLSPGELNAGVGMTYNTSNAKKTFTFDASISPLSYNLMICTTDRIPHSSFNIPEDKKTQSKYGSSLECKLMWQMSSNIKLVSRLFGFTDYKRAYTDLENTISFEINKYLSTQVFVHLRYDTMTPTVDPSWHKLQVKEILSLGFTYKFSTI